jgi:hypothetical protein
VAGPLPCRSSGAAWLLVATSAMLHARSILAPNCTPSPLVLPARPQILKQLAAKYKDRPFSYFWAEGGAQPVLEANFGVGCAGLQFRGALPAGSCLGL